MPRKYVLVDSKQKAWCWTKSVPRLRHGQQCIPVDVLKALTGVGRFDKSSWKQDPSLLRDATPGFEPSHTDDEALSNIWRAGGYLRTSTFRIAYRSREYAEKRARTMEAHGLIGRFTDPSPKSGRGPASYVIHLTERGAERVAAGSSRRMRLSTASRLSATPSPDLFPMMPPSSVPAILAGSRREVYHGDIPKNSGLYIHSRASLVRSALWPRRACGVRRRGRISLPL